MKNKVTIRLVKDTIGLLTHKKLESLMREFKYVSNPLTKINLSKIDQWNEWKIQYEENKKNQNEAFEILKNKWKIDLKNADYADATDLWQQKKSWDL